MKITEQQIRDALKAFIARQLSVSFVAEVIGNDKAESEGLVAVKYNELEFDAKLQAVTRTTDKGLLVVPTVGSLVFCTSEGNSSNMFVVVSYTAVDKVLFNSNDTSIQADANGIQLTQGDYSLVIDNDGWTFNGGKLKGMVKLDALAENLDSIKKYVEAIHSALPSAFTAIGTSTAANGANGAASYNSAMGGKSINIQNMENDRIKQ